MVLQIKNCRQLGSSPQARGTHTKLTAGDKEIRFIPAGAGNTSRLRLRLRQMSVHPRRRGEHHISRSVYPDFRGSSPQARGTRQAPQPAPASGRFIPAGAGNTSQHYGCMAGPQVHPRRRGEHFTSLFDPQKISGSSPQARGTLSLSNLCNSHRRFIPAGAGNTQMS